MARDYDDAHPYYAPVFRMNAGIPSPGQEGKQG